MATLLLFLELAVVVAMIYLGAKTAHLCEVLAAGGVDMYITGSNPLSTQDDVLITPDGARRLGSRRLPIAPDEVEAVMK